MRKLILAFALLAVYSCKKDDNPDPVFQTTISKQQAPFGAATADLKLKKVYYNGYIQNEYIYAGDKLNENKRFTPLAQPIHFATGEFRHNGPFLFSYEIQMRGSVQTEPVNPATQGFQPTFVTRYAIPETDSVRSLAVKSYPANEVFFTDYFFDKSGFITRRETSKRDGTDKPTIIYYTRNSAHDISRSMVVYPAIGSEQHDLVYDNHPNPFFYLGMDNVGLIGTRSLSPHNVVKETITPVDGSQYTIHYVYEYLPNGYPKKVTVTDESIQNSTYTLTFEY